MAEFTEVIRQRNRMCKFFYDGCRNCELNTENNGHGFVCSEFLKKYPQEAEEIIMS